MSATSSDGSRASNTSGYPILRSGDSICPRRRATRSHPTTLPCPRRHGRRRVGALRLNRGTPRLLAPYVPSLLTGSLSTTLENLKIALSPDSIPLQRPSLATPEVRSLGFRLGSESGLWPLRLQAQLGHHRDS